jgi:hypothetical protein
MRVLIDKGATVYGIPAVFVRAYHDNSSIIIGEAKVQRYPREIDTVGFSSTIHRAPSGRLVSKTWKGNTERNYESAWRYAYRIAIGTDKQG